MTVEMNTDFANIHFVFEYLRSQYSIQLNKMKQYWLGKWINSFAKSVYIDDSVFSLSQKLHPYSSDKQPLNNTANNGIL